MAEVIGVLNVCVVRGAHLAVADPLTHSSDPYVVLHYASQKVKTSVKKKNMNPEWNEILQLSITNPSLPLKLEVFDEDKFTADDSMGTAEFTVTDLYDAARMDLRRVLGNTRIKTIYPVAVNCLASESHIAWKDGKVIQDVVLKLKNVNTGSIQLHLQWVHAPGAKN